LLRADRSLLASSVIVCLGLLSFDAGAQNSRPTAKAKSAPVAASDIELPLDLLLAATVARTDQAKLIRIEQLAGESAAVRAAAPLDPTIRANATLIRNDLDQATPSNVDRTDVAAVSTSVSKLLPTGTVVGAEIGHRRTELERTGNVGGGGPQGGGAAGAGGPDAFHETNAAVSVRQRLWRDGFGVATADRQRSADLARTAAEFSANAQLERLAMQTVDIYHRTWSTQVQIRSSRERVTRQERLLTASRQKLNLGTMEQSDFLQLETSVLAVRDQIADLEKQLGDTWRGLVLAAKLGDDWLIRDPMTINLSITPASGAREAGQRICASAPGDQFAGLASVRALSQQVESLDAALSATRSQSKPDLFAEVRLATNSVDERMRVTVPETGRGRHPQVTIGAGIEMTLGGSADRAAIVDATRAKTRAEVQLSTDRDNANLRWMTACRDLERLVRRQDLLATTANKLSERVRLEARRFDVGKADISAAIRAEDDLATTALQKSRVDAEVSQLEWTLTELRGELGKRIEIAVRKLDEVAR